MANDVDSPEGQQQQEEAGPNIEDLARWAHNVSQETGAADQEIPGDDEVLDEDIDAGDGKDGKPAAAAKPAKEAPADPAKEEKPVLMAKDGKNTLPYSRLEESNAARDAAKAEAEQERAKAAELEKQLATQAAELKALKDGADKGTTTAADAAQSADDLEKEIERLEAEAETVREESPWQADQLQGQLKLTRRLLAQTRTLETQLTEQRAKTEQEKAEQVKQVKAQQEQQESQLITAAMKDVPSIKHWETTKPAFYTEAVRIHRELLADPVWDAKTYTERFKEVEKRMVAEYGESILPTDSGKKPAAAVKPEEKKPLPKDEGTGVASLTDLPGGAPTAGNALEAVADADVTALSTSLLNSTMSADDIVRWATKS